MALSATFIVGVLVGSQILSNVFSTSTAISSKIAPDVPTAVAAVDDAWKSRRYFPRDLDAHFGIVTLPRMEVPESLKPYIEAHDVTKDQQYVDNADLYANYARVFGPLLDKLPGRVLDDKRFYVKWAGDEKQYGVFADHYIPHYDHLFEYSGQLTNTSRSTSYEWHYYSSGIVDKAGSPLILGTDAQFLGNIARFVNHDDDPNCDSVYVPWRNEWRILYIATRPIFPGEEITVSYGANYWKTREAGPTGR
ncbi:hypothetical protein HKX48_004589 [Thoreauomyces humboldtii]|nr:hypothetical protein HKX48_004589 [Thoreauomyces humboldtii]